MLKPWVVQCIWLTDECTGVGSDEVLLDEWPPCAGLGWTVSENDAPYNSGELTRHVPEILGEDNTPFQRGLLGTRLFCVMSCQRSVDGTRVA